MSCLCLTFAPGGHFYIVVEFSTSHTNNELSLHQRNLNFCTVVICTEKTKRYKNQIDLSKLSDPKLIDKKRCHSVTKNVTALRCLFSFFIWAMRARRNFFYQWKARFMLYKLGSRPILIGDCRSQRIERWARALETHGPFTSQCYMTINHFWKL